MTITTVATLAAMQSQATDDAAALDSILSALKAQPKDANRDFACQSIERLIAAQQSYRLALAPALRMVGTYEGKGR